MLASPVRNTEAAPIETPFGDFGADMGDMMADFGGFVTLPVGTWDVTVNIAIVGCVIPDGEFYMAQQFREPDPTGEGAFDTAYSTVFTYSIILNLPP